VTRPLGVSFEIDSSSPTGQCTRKGCTNDAAPGWAFCASDVQLRVMRSEPTPTTIPEKR
jgi:hypothetical protein